MQDSDEKLIVSELMSKVKTLENRRQPWEPLWKEVMEFCFPTRNFDPRIDQSKDKYPKVNFNNRAALDVSIASAGFQGYTANRRQVWCKLQFEDLKLMKEYMVSDWIEECERVLYAVFARYGLYESLSEIVLDGMTVGTSTLYIEDIGKGRIAYQARHPLSVWCAENAYGEIDTIMEDIPMTFKATVDRFGEDRVSTRILEQSKRDPYGIVIIRHIVTPKDDKLRKLAKKAFDPKMPFNSIWIDVSDSRIMDVGAYWEFPHAVWRYSKNAGEEYGRSPAQNALGDIMAANQMSRSRIRLGNQIADPTLLVDEALEGQDTIIPGYHIYRENHDDTIEPVPIGANYPITKDNEERQDALIDAQFHIPIYLMLQQMERQMTAREVIERTGEKAAVLGPITGRYEREVLQRVVQRTFNILLRNGLLPEPPPPIIETQGKAKLKIEFVGFLSQLQQRYYQTTGLNAALAYIQAVGQMFPTSLDWVDQDKLIVEGMESAAAPASVIREEDDVIKLRMERLKAQQQMQEQAMQMQQEQMIAQNANKLSKKPEPGSPLENIEKVMAEGAME